MAKMIDDVIMMNDYSIRDQSCIFHVAIAICIVCLEALISLRNMSLKIDDQ